MANGNKNAGSALRQLHDWMYKPRKRVDILPGEEECVKHINELLESGLEPAFHYYGIHAKVKLSEAEQKAKQK